eukprot:15454571-Alexandrium_andersonii.AAC.1
MAGCKSAGRAGGGRRAGSPSRGLQGGRSSTTGPPDPGASPRPLLGGPHTWASVRPSLRREVERTPP